MPLIIIGGREHKKRENHKVLESLTVFRHGRKYQNFDIKFVSIKAD